MTGDLWKIVYDWLWIMQSLHAWSLLKKIYTFPLCFIRKLLIKLISNHLKSISRRDKGRVLMIVYIFQSHKLKLFDKEFIKTTFRARKHPRKSIYYLYKYTKSEGDRWERHVSSAEAMERSSCELVEREKGRARRASRLKWCSRDEMPCLSSLCSLSRKNLWRSNKGIFPW